MILPLSHEDSSTRRLPWVTLSIMALCVLVFLFTDTGTPENVDAGDPMEEATSYWREHAYLEPDPKIRDAVAYDVPPAQRRQYLATLAELSEPLRPEDEEGLAAQQAELQRLTDLALGRAPVDPSEQTALQRWGYVPNAPRAVTLITHAFLHGGWIHLIGNLFMLLLSAPAIEDRWGRLLFPFFYLAAGAVGAWFHAAFGPGPELPLIGASGAIAGVMGAFLVRLWNTRIRFGYFFVFGLRPVWGTFEAAAWVMLPLWFANELFQGMLWSSAGMASGVAYWAHVGGFAFGAAAAYGVRALRFEERFVDPNVEARITHYAANPVLEQAMEAREKGDLARSLELLEAEWKRKPDEDLATALWDVAVASAKPEAGVAPMLGALRSALKRNDTALALEQYCGLMEHAPRALPDPASLLKLVPALVEAGQKQRAAQALRQALDPANKLTGGQALRLVDMARALDPACALRAAQLAMASTDLHPARREKLAALVAELEQSGVAAAAPSAVAAEPEPVAADDAATPPPLPPEMHIASDGSIAMSRFARSKLGEVVPRALDADALRIRVEDGTERRVGFEKIQAVAVAIVAGLAPKPILVIDLLANWNESEAEELRGVRLRSDRFDPRKLIGGEPDANPQQAFAALVGRLLSASRGVPLPGPEAALGKPFARFASQSEYEQAVLEIAEPAPG